MYQLNYCFEQVRSCQRETKSMENYLLPVMSHRYTHMYSQKNVLPMRLKKHTDTHLN